MPPHLHLVLSRIADFLAYQEQFRGVQGFLRDLEGYTLLELAAHGEGSGVIVEIGSFMGRSTAFLAAGSKRSGREKIYAIDHFKGSPEHQVGQPFSHPILQTEGSTFRVFTANMQRLGLSEQVVAVQSTSAEAARTWHEPIRLLFIDGDHAYDAIRQDYSLWSPFVAPMGYICFHDVGEHPEVTRFYQQLIAITPTLREVCAVQCLKVVQKTRA